MFDIGPDFRQQMLTHGVDHLDAILITHAHRDHVGGLDDIRSFNYVQHRKMDLYLTRRRRRPSAATTTIFSSRMYTRGCLRQNCMWSMQILLYSPQA